MAQADRDTADIDLEITVVDKANHAETLTESVTVARQVLLIDAVPESGFLRPGVENIVYLQVSYPDGQGAEAELTVQAGDAKPGTVRTDEYGLATIALTPATHQDVALKVKAIDDQGQSAEQTLTLGTTGGATAVLLRPEKAAYRIGETLNVDAYVAGHATTVYLDVVKEGQTFGLAALPVENGAARASLDVDGSLLGTVELHAYVITDQGEIVRDRRLILVNPAPAQVDVKADAEVYRPGDVASLALTVSRDGQPMPGALGISIVDESVFSVGAQDPGFARTYFLLERGCWSCADEIHDFTPLGGERSPYDREVRGGSNDGLCPGPGKSARRSPCSAPWPRSWRRMTSTPGNRRCTGPRLMAQGGSVQAGPGSETGHSLGRPGGQPVHAAAHRGPDLLRWAQAQPELADRPGPAGPDRPHRGRTVHLHRRHRHRRRGTDSGAGGSTSGRKEWSQRSASRKSVPPRVGLQPARVRRACASSSPRPSTGCRN